MGKKYKNKNSSLKEDKILICGNEAIGKAAIEAECMFYAGYPITPQNELTAYMAKNMPENGRVFIQAESEVAAINMVFGASAAGARAMTSSSSPGISLKQEGISYISAARLPAVIINMMRGGPGLGNILASQGDYFQAVKGGGHGDYHIIVLAAWNVQELYDLSRLSFDLADKYRIPVMILGDGMLGQMMEPIKPIRATEKKVSFTKKPWALTGCSKRQPNVIKSLYLKEAELEEMNLLLQKTYQQIKKSQIKYEEIFSDDAEVILVAYGTVSRICRDVVNKLRDNNIKAGLFRPISLWPFPENRINFFANKVKKILVVEMSSGQMLEDVKLAAGNNSSKVAFYGRTGGGIPEEEVIFKKVQEFVNE
jgi:2-oxoglutarate ferredoxin oxidoreductase subunit alpha